MSPTEPLHYDPFDATIRHDPHPVYRRLRDEAPVYFIEKYEVWALSRFDDIWRVANDTEHLTNTKGAASAQLLTKDQPAAPTINTIDPPEHTELRSQIRRAFLPRNVKALEVHARALAERIRDEALERGHLDIVRDFGSRLSVTVVCHALGLPVEDGPLLTEYVQGFFSHDPDTGGMTPEGLASLGELNAYCVEALRERRRRGADGDDALSILARFEHAGRRYGDEEAGSHLGMLVIGGSETFPKVLASAMLRLAEHPHFRAELRGDLSLVPDAFDEVLRFDMPTQYLGRTVAKPFEVHGRRLEPGQGVVFLYPSGNRDEREFRDPDVFDIHRRPPRILSFGTGPHQCLGRHIARMEGRVSLETLLPALGDYEVDLANAVRLHTEFVQGYGSLPITFAARA
ncbi:MAG: cytochrome P450 [Myxococcota bacterium]|nr:cytochrome P450 [Myxococcales bacterium]